MVGPFILYELSTKKEKVIRFDNNVLFIGDPNIKAFISHCGLFRPNKSGNYIIK